MTTVPSQPTMPQGEMGEMQKLKLILRSKMKELDDLQDETSKRDVEYQKLLQENDLKLNDALTSKH